MLLRCVNRFLAPDGAEGGNNTNIEVAAIPAITGSDAAATTTVVKEEVVADELPIIEGEKVPLKTTTATKTGKTAAPATTTKEDLNTPIGALDDMSDDGIVTDKTIAKEKLEVAERNKVAPLLPTTKVEDKPVVKGGRDYTGFEDEDVKILKQAPNHLYDYFKDRLPKLYEAKKELAATKLKLQDASKGIVKLPDTYVEHPEAYILSPEYRTIATNLRTINSEKAHWIAQRERIYNGEPYQDIKGFSRDTGEMVLTDPIPIENEIDKEKAKDAVNKALNTVEQYENKFQGDFRSLKEQHLVSYQNQVKEIDKSCAVYFPWITDANVLNAQVDCIDIASGQKGKTSCADLFKKGMALLSPSLRSSPTARLFANAFVFMNLQHTKIKQLEGNQKVVTQIIKDKSEGEPLAGSKSSGSRAAATVNDKAIPSIADMME